MAENWVFVALNSSNAVTTITTPDSQTVSTTGTWPVGKTAGGEWAPKVFALAGGSVAAGVAGPGNPVYVGGLYFDAPYTPSGTQGTVAPFAFNSLTGRLYVQNAPTGAANVASGQVATSTTAATLIAARATRRSFTVINHDAAINVFIGPATVTAGNGFLVKPGTSATIETTALVQVIAASATPTVGFIEWYD